MEVRVNKKEVESYSDIHLGILIMAGTKLEEGLRELEAMKEWERSIAFQSNDGLKERFETRDVFRKEFGIIKLVAFERKFGNINLN